jgi:uncharacterized protein (DUF1778 family)
MSDDLSTSGTAPRTLSGMAGKIDRGRDARLELRLTPEEKALVEQAAALGGEDTSTFVRRVALIEARALLAKMRP